MPSRDHVRLPPGAHIRWTPPSESHATADGVHTTKVAGLMTLTCTRVYMKGVSKDVCIPKQATVDQSQKRSVESSGNRDPVVRNRIMDNQTS